MWISRETAEDWFRYKGWKPSTSLIGWEKRNRYLLVKNGMAKILDDGGAHGRNAIYLASLGIYDVYLTDVNVYSLKMGKEKVLDKSKDKKKRIEIIQSDSKYHPFQNEVFDAIISHSLTHWLNNLEEVYQYLLDCYRILRPQGILFGMTFKEWRKVSEKFSRYPIFVNKETLKELIEKSGFDIVKIYEEVKGNKIAWFFEIKK